ncbi:MAG: tape measure protein [Phascolarctobacterium sp.]
MAKQVKVEITADSSRFEQAMQGAAKATSDAGAKIDNAGKQFDNMANKVQASVTKVNTACGKASKALDGVNKSMSALGAVQLGSLIGTIAGSIVNLGISSVKAAAQMRQYEIAFQTMLKSADAGTQMLRDLQKFAAETPFDVPGVVKAGQQLMAFGFQAKEIIPMLTSLGDAASGLGMGTEGVGRLAYALGQMQTSGKLNAQDMMQLTSAGISAWDMLAQAAGKTVAEMKDLCSKGAIDSKAAVQTIVAGMNEQFGGMMAKTSDEVAGLLANIEETAGNTSVTIGQYMTEAFNIKGILKDVSDKLGEFQKKMQEATDAGKSFTDVIKECVPAPVIAAIGALSAIIVGTLVAALVAAVAAMGAAIGLTAPIVAGLAAVGAAIAGVIVYWDNIRDAFSAGMEAIFTTIAIICDAIAEAFLWLGKANVEVFSWMFETIAGYCPEWLKDFNEMLDKAIESVRTWAQEAIEWFRQVLAAKQRATTESSSDGSHGGGGGSYGDAPAEEQKKQPEKEKPVYNGKLFTPSDSSIGKTGSKKFGQLESEVNRVSEALTRAGKATKDLQEDFDKMSLDIATAGLKGSDQVFAKIDQEKQARMKAVDEMLSKQLQAVQEAEALRASAERTGNAESIVKAKALYDERNALYAASLAQEQALKDAIDQQAYEKSISLETALQAAKADMNAAFNEQEREKFLEYLNSEQEAKMVALQQEQELRQQLLDWRMESQQNMLDFELQAGETIKNQLASGIANVITEGGKLSDVFKDITKSIVNMFIQFMIKKQAAAALEKLLGKKQAVENAANSAKEASAAVPAAVQKSIATLGPIAGPPAYAAATATMTAAGLGSITAGNIMQKANGGPVFGAGTGTSDSIPAMLSNGEYVINAKAVRRLGLPLLNALNNGYAAGGAVSVGGGGSGAVVEFNNYGDINNGTDYDGLMADFEYTLAMGMRG